MVCSIIYNLQDTLSFFPYKRQVTNRCLPGHLVFTSPSNTWQDYLDMRLTLESRTRSNHALQREMQGISLSSPTNSTSMQQTREYGESITQQYLALIIRCAAIADSPEITEANLKNLHARLCGMWFIFRAMSVYIQWFKKEEINSWLSSDETNTYQAAAIPNQFVTNTDYTPSSPHSDFMLSSPNEGRFHNASVSHPNGDGQRSHGQPFQTQYGALCDVLGLDRKEWGI